MLALLAALADGNKYQISTLVSLLNNTEKEIQQKIITLQAQGIAIRVTSTYCQLIPQLSLLDIKSVKQKLPYQIIFKPIINSTNQFLLENIENLNKGDVCLTEYQYSGRGRRGRQWHSPFAGQAILSFYWTLSPTISINGLSLVIGLAIADTLIELGASDIELKWPNDVLLKGRKLAGILIELSNHKNGLINLVVGLGINLSIPKQNSKIDQPWAELIEVLPKIDRTELTIQLVNKLYQYLLIFEQDGIAFFRERWFELDHFLGQEVKIISEKEVIMGIEKGINNEGFLILEKADNSQLEFNAGEVSLRKV
ncbi:BirA family biotin operon repressor/biotin-[acetyl-CoA-carboxylase] ligase [Bisgaardia hudsonensis]|uniref:biotin--[biotin carboxyl-carrier protein] ligase n=1 Tax=Bisgaardia hudsonensis TaxID=109472 RepID=A0A4R2MYZ2_9PAST|nr:bifunctional biotin--[acetyl-CoA-carboxylase] ligase/biotin operon repressor BirA [Bisgaardia hudsonensis]QLB13301.1 biotin--[acetyl-CoA-carboxylase] ligase [Bisgaardia hudsonensis]TCP12698.1 BirA family biotin operon repressor/biotin-[acetyl-CoA-carboxylase] ligase [Bisgaardia hudsonensis]